MAAPKRAVLLVILSLRGTTDKRYTSLALQPCICSCLPCTQSAGVQVRHFNTDAERLPQHLRDATNGANAPRARLQLVQLEEQVGFLRVVVARLHLTISVATSPQQQSLSNECDCVAYYIEQNKSNNKTKIFTALMSACYHSV